MSKEGWGLVIVGFIIVIIGFVVLFNPTLGVWSGIPFLVGGIFIVAGFKELSSNNGQVGRGN
ncbi:MAG: hypothetical protein WCX22_01895 [Methanoregula sp.]